MSRSTWQTWTSSPGNATSTTMPPSSNPLDQPARPSSRRSRSRATGRAAIRGPRARRPSHPARAGLQRLHRARPHPRRAVRLRLLQRAGAAIGLPARSARRTANGKAANSVGSVRLDVQVGNPVTPVDEADVLVTASLTDVRNQSQPDRLHRPAAGQHDGPDHGREQRQADGSDPATVSDVPLSAAMSCAATPSTTIGGDCSVSTSLDALVPGTVTESDAGGLAAGRGDGLRRRLGRGRVDRAEHGARAPGHLRSLMVDSRSHAVRFRPALDLRPRARPCNQHGLHPASLPSLA